MAAELEYTWDYIAPYTSVSVYIHGYTWQEAVAYSAVVYPLQGEAYTPWGAISMTQTDSYLHVDGTIARVINVQNLAPFNPCTVNINMLFDSY